MFFFWCENVIIQFIRKVSDYMEVDMRIVRLKGVYFMILVIAFVMFCGMSVMAQDYETGDIDRIYITCDKEMNNLTKAVYESAVIEVVRKDGKIDVSDHQAFVKLRGNSTLKAEKKPVKIKFSSKVSVLGMDKGKKWNVLANAFDKTLMRNALCLELGTRMGLNYISQTRFVDLYYNNQLIGNYLITEPVEAGTGKVEIDESGDDFLIELERERYESDVTYVQTKNGIRFAINEPEIPTDSQYKNIENYLMKVENALKTNRLSEYSKYIDVDSFINYYIVSEIFKAVDFNYSSTRFYVKDNKMYAGPLWDVDLSSGNASKTFYKDYYEGNISYRKLFCTQMKWYSYLIKSDEFISRLNERVKKMFTTIENMYTKNGLGNSRIDYLLESYRKSFERNYESVLDGGAGWSITKRYSICDNPIGLEFENHPKTYIENVTMLRNWLKNRVDYLRKEWAEIRNNRVDDLEAEKKSYNSIALSWYNSGEADGNEIWCRTLKGKYKLVKTIFNGYAGECTIKKLKPGIKYTFKVRSFIKNGSGKIYSDFVSVHKTIKFKSPKCKVKKLNNGLRISWNKVKGADGYIIYRKNKKAVVIKGNKKNKFVFKKAKSKKRYKVRAYVKCAGKKIISK